GSTPATSSFANGWATSGGGTNGDIGYGIAVSGTSVYVTGSFISATNASIAGQPLAGAGFNDVFVAKYTDTSTGSTPATSSFANGWAASGGGTSNDIGYGIAVSGTSVYAGGQVGIGVATFGPAVGRVLAPAGSGVLGGLDPATGTWQRAEGPLQGGTSATRATATDSRGNVFITGSFSGSVSFGGTRLTSAGSNDVFVAKWDATAQAFTWATSGGGTGNDVGYGLAVSGTSVYVTGSFTSATSASFAGQPLAGAGNTDVFVAKYTDTSTGSTPATSSFANGWATRGGGTSADIGNGIAVSGTSVYVTGSFTSATSASFAGQPLTGAGGTDVFVAKYTDTSTGSTPATSSFANGWATSGGGTSDDIGNGLAVSGTSVYVTGYFASATSTSFAGQPLSGAGGIDMFVAKYTDTSTGSTPATSSFANGWATRGGGTGSDFGNGLAVSGTSVYVTGYFFSATSASFAGQALAGAGGTDMFVAKYTDTSTGSTPATSSFANGWATSGGGTSTDYGFGLAVSGTSVYVTGSFTSATSASFAGQALAGAGSDDVFVAKYTDTSTGSTPATSSFANGWATSGGGTSADQGNGIAVSGTSVYAGGQVTPPATFGSSTFGNSVSGQINFLGELRDVPPAPVISSFSPTSGPAGQVVTILGTNFTGATAVAFNSTAAASFVVNSSTQLTATVAAGSTTGTISVTTPGGTATSASVFTVCAAPVATAQNVSVTLDASGQATVTATAVNNGSTADCGLAAAGTLSVSPSTFTCANLGANTVTLTVTDAGGNTATTTATVTVSMPATPTTTWTGTAGTAWTDCANWSFGKVPDATTDVVVPAGLSRYPSLTAGTLTARALTVELGASLTTSAGATLAVYGDWTVDGTATLAGPVAFQGSTDQALGGLGAATFTSLTVDKPAGTLTLQRAASVTGSLTLSRGLLATGAHELTITGATLSETSTAYVLGRLVTAANMNGRGTRYAFGGLGLVLTPGATGALPGVTTVRRVTGTALTGQGTSVSIKRYYDIVPATNAGLNATLEFGYRDAELNGLSEAQLELFRSSTGTSGPWQNVKASTRDAAANTVTATGVDHFSIWTLGSSANPLPVELTAFTATAEGPAAVRLNWTTTTEKNSARFEVERSPDGATFARIGTVAAAGTSSTRRTYTLRDAQLPAGPAALYYRLRQVDHDGTVSLSPVRVVRRTPAVGLTLYPNPTRHAATLGGALPGTRVQVLDALGRPVLTTTADATGTATLTLPAGRPAGVYVVRAGTQAVRLVVE
ncbi:Por secretion system C-terminal sorting domain-containing protein, partial [Hymenobacter daecheongensis DSM 21074]